MNPHHKTTVSGTSWRCSCSLGMSEFSVWQAIAAAEYHENVACHHCTQPFGAHQPDCPNPNNEVQFRHTQSTIVDTTASTDQDAGHELPFTTGKRGETVPDFKVSQETIDSVRSGKISFERVDVDPEAMHKELSDSIDAAMVSMHRVPPVIPIQSYPPVTREAIEEIAETFRITSKPVIKFDGPPRVLVESCDHRPGFTCPDCMVEESQQVFIENASPLPSFWDHFFDLQRTRPMPFLPAKFWSTSFETSSAINGVIDAAIDEASASWWKAIEEEHDKNVVERWEQERIAAIKARRGIHMPKVDMNHTPRPGPDHYDWRCLVCDGPVSGHPGLLKRLWRRWRNR